MEHIGRAGHYVKQPSGYLAFVPAGLPPKSSISMDPETVGLLSDADSALGKLDGAAWILPDPDLFVAMYVRQEAVLSSQIEGTQSTLEDVIDFELPRGGRKSPPDVREVVNYVRAMNLGLQRIKETPLSLVLVREIHAELLKGVRGGDRTPGEFRTIQNWIGPQDCTLAEAIFVPPPPREMMEALGSLETFMRERGALPVLVHCALVHAQFETIHPFIDGNGRVGRLLITLLLCHEGKLERPLLYLSLFLKRRRQEYYDRLTAIRERGDWEGWVRFFLEGVAQVSREATETAKAVHQMRERLQNRLRRDALALQFLNYLFLQPAVNASVMKDRLGCSYGKVYTLLRKLTREGILREVTGRSRNRLYRFQPYLALFEEPLLPRTADEAGSPSPPAISRRESG
jgi:Fic family protein